MLVKRVVGDSSGSVVFPQIIVQNPHDLDLLL
jgi:hypothetical protein